ncbi:MAG: hypothetical protein F6K10_32065 [Moorea sp. SIO2B7]|nr:hypothetical protein [Moorena sp. SIO2B7]
MDNLPEEKVKTDITLGCQAGGKGNASFYNVGLGGLPLSPDDFFIADTIIGEWIELDDVFETTDSKMMKISSQPIFRGRLSINCR